MTAKKHTKPSKLDRPEILSAIFHPRKEPRTPLPQGAEDLEIPVSEKTIVLGCRFYKADESAPTLLYFHGNGETVSDYDNIAPFYLKYGLNLAVASYRGYGWSSGEPTVTGLFEDNGEIFDFITDYRTSAQCSGPVFIMGRSLGAASAIDLACERQEEIKGLIIESGFADTLPLARRLGYDTADGEISEEDCFNNVDKIREIEVPTLILHGAYDQLIPVQEAVKLHAESGAKTKQFFIIPGADHNSLITSGGELYFETIKKFTDTVTGNNTWRQRRLKLKKQKE